MKVCVSQKCKFRTKLFSKLQCLFSYDFKHPTFHTDYKSLTHASLHLHFTQNAINNQLPSQRRNQTMKASATKRLLHNPRRSISLPSRIKERSRGNDEKRGGNYAKLAVNAGDESGGICVRWKIYEIGIRGEERYTRAFIPQKAEQCVYFYFITSWIC